MTNGYIIIKSNQSMPFIICRRERNTLEVKLFDDSAVKISLTLGRSFSLKSAGQLQLRHLFECYRFFCVEREKMRSVSAGEYNSNVND